MNTLQRQEAFQKAYSFDENLTLLFPSASAQTREEVVYRRNGKSVDKIIEFDANTGSKLKTTHFDYFNDKKIRSIDEFDIKSGRKIRTINYVLYKSIDEYDINTGKKARTINYSIKDETKISSIQEYNNDEQIVLISIFKRDGKTVSITKQINPETNKVTNLIHKNNNSGQNENRSIATRSYDKIKDLTRLETENIAHLIDNLYKDSLKFENVNP